MTSRRVLTTSAVVALCMAGSFFAGQAVALPLTEAACERYAAERRTLIRLGVRGHFRKGAEWAQANLTEPQLDLIQRYIRIKEALAFRCPEQYAALPAKTADEPRRLDVVPPVPGRKPAAPDSETGVTRTVTPPPPSKGPKDQG
ncbi:MAG: hypothetical protein ACLFPA_00350 [Dichotomicrobium sp.]